MGSLFPLFPNRNARAPLSTKILRGTTAEPVENLQAKLKEVFPNGFRERHLLILGTANPFAPAKAFLIADP